MSWATHDVEPYVIKRHIVKLEKVIGFKISFVAILVGSWTPDLFTKWLVYGISIGGYNVRAHDPAQFHRGWPGVGFTHSLAYGVAFGGLVYLISKSKTWGVGLTIGIWAHVLSDTLDTNGVMLFFPISLARVHFDAWKYAGEQSRFYDGAAYFSSLGFVWDALWLAMVLVNWRVLTLSYFRAEVLPTDPFWGAIGHYLPEPALVVLYRGAFFYGLTRWCAWLIWVHGVHHGQYPFDLHWGGPSWVPDFNAPK